MSFGTDESGERARPKAWKGNLGQRPGASAARQNSAGAELIARFKKEYDEAVDPPL